MSTRHSKSIMSLSPLKVPLDKTDPDLSGENPEPRSSARIRDSNQLRMLGQIGGVHNNCVDATLTDFYQITMAYAYWKVGKHEESAVFDAYFRKCPFNGE